MTLDTFFVKFELFANAPDAVAKMRELVLILAVQGSLVQQDSNEESAEALLQQIEITRNRTGKAANGRKLEMLPPVEPDASPYELPPGWAWCRLGTLGLIGSSCRVHEKDWTTNGVPFLRAREIVKLAKFGRVDNELFIKEEHYQSLASEGLFPEPNDIMITGVGTIGVPFVVGNTDRFYFKDASVLIFKNWFGLYPYYLHLVMQSPYWINEIHKESMGTTVHTLTIVRAKQALIPLPPLAEQKRIVAKVDELMALCDRLEAQQQERETQHAVLARAALARFAEAPTPANLDFLFRKSYTIPPTDLRKCILTLAVQRKLVKSTVEPDERTVGDHIDFLNGYAFKSQWFKPEGIRLCRNVNVSHGVVDWRESAFVDDNVAKEFQRFALSEGDIVLSLDRPIITTGLKVARIRKSDLPCLLLQRVAKPVPKHDQIDMSYFMLWLNSSEFVDTINPGRSNGVPHISTKQVQLLPFVLPPLAEQRRIVAKVDQLMALVDALETLLAASRTAAANLLSALVAELTGVTGNTKVAASPVSGTRHRGRPRKAL